MDIAAALVKPFPPDQVGWKPQSVKGSRALAIAYIDARDVMDRLDAVLGVGNWQDRYAITPDGSVVCRLWLKLDGRWVCKVDVGSPSEQPDGGDRMKAAFSDALKRAAVKFGIGRYLYHLPHQWADYDPVKKQFAGTPGLPPWALPGGSGRPYKPDVPTSPPPARNGNSAARAKYAMKVGQCKTLTELKLLWEEIVAESHQGKLGADDLANLTRLKDDAKKVLSPAATVPAAKQPDREPGDESPEGCE